MLADAQELYVTASLKLGVIRLRRAAPARSAEVLRERANLVERVALMLGKAAIRALREMGFDFVAFDVRHPRRCCAASCQLIPRVAGAGKRPCECASLRRRAAPRDDDAAR